MWTSTRMPSVRRSQPILTMAATEGYAPVAVPDFSHEEYYVTDYYSAAYPGFTTYEHALVLDEPYYSRYTVAWDDLPLPTEEMQRWALPEGVLPPGSSLSGFLSARASTPARRRSTSWPSSRTRRPGTTSARSRFRWRPKTAWSRSWS